MNLIKFLLIFMLSLNAFALTLEEERKYDELEGVAFIRALVADKKYQEVVDQFPTFSKKDSDIGEIYFHLATSYYNLKSYEKSYSSLEKGSKFKISNRADYYSLWARASVKLKKFKQCRQLFKKVPLEKVHSEDWENYFNCLQKSDHEKEALSLALNANLSGKAFFLISQRTLLANGLYGFALEKRQNYLNQCRSVDFYLRLWSEFDKIKNPDIDILETAHSCHPKSLEVTSQLVKILFKEGRYHSVAYLFETLSREEKAYLKHAGEFYKVAGRNTVADYFFTLGEEQDYLLARSAYFLGQENYAALLTIPFRPEQVKGNKDLSYAIAYSHFKFLNLKGSRIALAQMHNINTRDKQLQSLLDQCEILGWKCRP